jgi:WD40 repeat protein/serine/threonine protein kinase
VRGYEILCVLGFGGMGIVYKARQLDLNRIVALKMVRGNSLDDPVSRHRFQSEAEAVARLQHPNIIQVFEIGLAEPQGGELTGRPFIALEYVEGGSLAEQIQTPRPALFAARIVEKLARAAHAAHQVGVIHRDLKPANVLLTALGEPKIADFGLAKQMGERDGAGRFLTQAGTLMGTPEYMAPEQVTDSTPTPAVDTYALGVILYELLTGQVPFTAATPVETLDLARTQEPVSPRQINPAVPRDLETICLKCLEKEPQRRYTSAQALADDLHRFLNDQPVLARRLAGLEKVWRWGRRNPLVAGLLSSVVGIFLAAFVLVSWSYWRSEQARSEVAQQRDEALRRERAERWARYRASIVAANNALRVSDVNSASQILADAPQESRHWEWHYLNARLDLAERVLRPGDFDYHRATFLQEGKRAVLSGPDNSLRVWGIPEEKELPFSGQLPDTGQFSPDGRFYAYPQTSGGVVLVDVTAGRPPVVLIAGKMSQPVGFSGDSSRLVTLSDDTTLQVWDVRTGSLWRTVPLDFTQCWCIGPNQDGRLITYGKVGTGIIHVYDVETEQTVASLQGHGRGLLGTQFAPDSKRVLTMEGYPGNVVRLWEVDTGKLLATMAGHTNQVLSVAFSPDGTRIATGGRDQTAFLWDCQSGKQIATLRGHVGWIIQVAFSPDGRELLTTSLDHTVRVWEAEDGKLVTVLHGHKGGVAAATWLADGRRIASASADGSIRLWDPQAIANHGVLRGHTTFVYGVAFHPDGEQVASASWDGSARLWEATSGQQRNLFQHGDEELVSSVAYHPLGKYLATRSRTALRLWDPASGEEVHRWEVRNGGWFDTRVVFNRQGNRVATGCSEKQIRIYDVESRREVAVLGGHRAEIRDLAFSPDGCWLASIADGDGSVRIWDVERGVETRALGVNLTGGYAVAFNTRGTLLAAGSTDGLVRLWNTKTWEEVAVLKHRAAVYTVVFSPDGLRLVCGCEDNTIRLWNIASQEEVAELRGHTGYVHQLAFSRDGSRLASASGDGTVRIWDSARRQERKSQQR